MGPHRRGALAYMLYAALDRHEPELTATPTGGVYRGPDGQLTVRHQARAGLTDRTQIEAAIERARVEILGRLPGHPLAGT